MLNCNPKENFAPKPQPSSTSSNIYQVANFDLGMNDLLQLTNEEEQKLLKLFYNEIVCKTKNNQNNQISYMTSYLFINFLITPVILKLIVQLLSFKSLINYSTCKTSRNPFFKGKLPACQLMYGRCVVCSGGGYPGWSIQRGGPLLCSLLGGPLPCSLLGGSTSMFTSGGVHFHVHFQGGPM